MALWVCDCNSFWFLFQDDTGYMFLLILKWSSHRFQEIIDFHLMKVSDSRRSSEGKNSLQAAQMLISSQFFLWRVMGIDIKFNDTSAIEILFIGPVLKQLLYQYLLIFCVEKNFAYVSFRWQQCQTHVTPQCCAWQLLVFHLTETK